MIINYFIDLFSFILEFLLKQTIYAAIIFAIIFIITLFLKKKSPLWHYGLWALIFIRLLLPTDLNIPGSARSLVEQVPYMNNAIFFLDEISSIKNNAGFLIQKERPEKTPSEKKIIFTDSNITELKKDSLPILIILFSFLWLTGCLIMTFFILKKIFRFRRIIRNSSEVIDDQINSYLSDWQHKLKIHRQIRTVSSDEFLSPFTIGLFRPVIFIPSNIIQKSDKNTVHSIIAHEMAHIRRCDALWIKIQNILQIIYFFNPIVWFAFKKISQPREQICDSIVLKYGIISSRVYGKSMLNVLKLNVFGSDLPELLPCFASQKNNYEHRIKNIKKEDHMNKRKKIIIISIICLLGLFILPFGSKYTAAEKTEKEKTEFTSPSPKEMTKFIEMLLKPRRIDSGEQIKPFKDVESKESIGSGSLIAEKNDKEKFEITSPYVEILKIVEILLKQQKIDYSGQGKLFKYEEKEK